MPEGLSGPEVGREISEHAKHAAEQGAADSLDHRKAEWISISEAILLSVVAIIAAYSGYCGRPMEHPLFSVARSGGRRRGRTKANQKGRSGGPKKLLGAQGADGRGFVT